MKEFSANVDEESHAAPSGTSDLNRVTEDILQKRFYFATHGCTCPNPQLQQRIHPSLIIQLPGDMHLTTFTLMIVVKETYMYLTLYKQTQKQLNNIDYMNIMHNPVQYTPIEYYKTTVYIEKPTPLKDLTTPHKLKIQEFEQHIERAWTKLKEFEHNYA
jgi:hypothetical protein